jgi:hypothetical protein
MYLWADHSLKASSMSRLKGCLPSTSRKATYFSMLHLFSFQSKIKPPIIFHMSTLKKYSTHFWLVGIKFNPKTQNLCNKKCAFQVLLKFISNKTRYSLMRIKTLALVVTITILAVFLLEHFFVTSLETEEENLELYFGIDVAYTDMKAIQNLIDEISSYTNLFIIGSTGVSHNKTNLETISQYLVEKDMNFIVYTHEPYTLEMIKKIEEKYPYHFLGIYFDDELGGKQLDIYKWRVVEEAQSNSDAANKFVEGVNKWLTINQTRNRTFPYSPSDFRLYTSDYSLYWFDYKAGYDVVFAEFGWNYSRQLNVALNRGAANVQNKDWGTIITWTYNNPPYIESGTELYNDLMLAYENQAKYIIIFDTNEEYTESILREEHLEAMKQFWEYTQKNPRKVENKKRVAFVLPKDYGYGFRGPEDKIWGLWHNDLHSLEISYHLGAFLEQYKTELDIIYDDEIKYLDLYRKYFYWNGTIVENP